MESVNLFVHFYERSSFPRFVRLVFGLFFGSLLPLGFPFGNSSLVNRSTLCPSSPLVFLCREGAFSPLAPSPFSFMVGLLYIIHRLLARVGSYSRRVNGDRIFSSLSKRDAKNPGEKERILRPQIVFCPNALYLLWAPKTETSLKNETTFTLNLAINTRIP